MQDPEAAHLLDYLDRQAALLRDLDGDAELLVQAAALIERLEREPVLRGLLADLDAETDAAVEAWRMAEREMATRLARHAMNFEAVLSGAGKYEAERVRGVAQRASEPPDLPFDPRAAWPRTEIDEAFTALERVRIDRTVARPEDRNFAVAGESFVRTQRERNHRRRAMAMRIRTEPAFALLRLRDVIRVMNPPLEPPEAPRVEPRYPRALGVGGVFDRYVFGEADPHDAADASIVSDIATIARDDLERLLVDLRRRIGAGASRLTIIRRFQTWAQWYARDRLRHVVEVARQREGPAQVERALTEELARFLFEQGLDPLWRPRFGRLEPDLLDPSEFGRLFVEAKQYETAAEARHAAAQGVRQTLDTAGLLVGTAHRLEEAFVVLFAVGGPRVDLPALVRLEGLTIRLVVVDITPWRQAGSGRRQSPVVVREADLLEVLEQLSPVDAEQGETA